MSAEPPEYDPSPETLQSLEQEIPILSEMRHFATRIADINWFCELGEPLDDEALHLARTYVNALGFPEADIAPIATWADAAGVAESLDMNAQGWEAEELLRASLMQEALSAVSEEGLGVMLTYLTERVQETASEAVEEALLYADEAETYRQLALGAIHQACHAGALVIASQNTDEHPLMLRFRLFELGRWPISLIGQSFHIF